MGFFCIRIGNTVPELLSKGQVFRCRPILLFVDVKLNKIWTFKIVITQQASIGQSQRRIAGHGFAVMP